jgi:hypothetical protein
MEPRGGIGRSSHAFVPLPGGYKASIFQEWGAYELALMTPEGQRAPIPGGGQERILFHVQPREIESIVNRWAEYAARGRSPVHARTR